MLMGVRRTLTPLFQNFNSLQTHARPKAGRQSCRFREYSSFQNGGATCPPVTFSALPSRAIRNVGYHSPVPSPKKRAASAFHSAKDAKEFLISRILAEADRESLPLTDVERKMLYFSEGHSTLPNMAEISDEFDRDYDQNSYEKKMAAVARRAYRHDWHDDSDDANRWLAAIRRLKSEDHYVSVILHLAVIRPPYDTLKLWLAAITVVALGFVIVPKLILIKDRLGASTWLNDRAGSWVGFTFAALLLVAAFLTSLPRNFVSRRRPPRSSPPPVPAPTEATYLEESARESRRRRTGFISIVICAAMLVFLCSATSFLNWPPTQQLAVAAWIFVVALLISSAVSDRAG
jgi:hypothetical protein